MTDSLLPSHVHIMVDLETWGLTPGSDIRSIGAVVFDPLAGTLGDEFYVNISAVPSAIDYGLTRDASTIAWWVEQSAEAKQLLMIDQVHIRIALARFADWWDEHQPEGTVTRFWAHGPHFDEAILQACYRATGSTQPWSHRAPRDCRTVWELAGDFSIPFEGVEHNALDDAKHQARCVIEAYRRIRKPKGQPTGFEVWQEPVNGQTMHSLKQIGGPYDNWEIATLDAYLTDCDEPAPDKRDFRQIVVRSVFA